MEARKKERVVFMMDEESVRLALAIVEQQQSQGARTLPLSSNFELFQGWNFHRWALRLVGVTFCVLVLLAADLLRVVIFS